MNYFKSHFKFNKQERSGIFFLLLFLVIVQTSYHLFDDYKRKDANILMFDASSQKSIDSLKRISNTKDTPIFYPFNPNFISDFKGYSLGMSIDEIDRLHNFRAGDRFVNSSAEFQEITKVSDSLLALISPYFKFPAWAGTSNSKNKHIKKRKVTADIVKTSAHKDLNTATIEELRKVNGIGEKLSARIIKFRDRLGGFLVDEQLYEVYYLEPEVADRVLKQFKVIQKPNIVKINVNTASVQELSRLVYIQKDLAQRIVNYRNLNGGINSLNDLTFVEGFPAEQIERIGLYLSL